MLFLLLIAIIITIIAFFSSFLFPVEVTETSEESDENGLVDASITAEPSQISIIIQVISISALIFLYFITIFIVKNEFRLKRFLEIGWIAGTPFIFITIFLNYYFDKLPCPAHHDLEIPMYLSIFLFLILYLAMFIIMLFETLVKFVKELNALSRKNQT